MGIRKDLNYWERESNEGERRGGSKELFLSFLPLSSLYFSQSLSCIFHHPRVLFIPLFNPLWMRNFLFLFKFVGRREEEEFSSFNSFLTFSIWIVQRGRREKRPKRFEWKDLEGGEWKTIRQRKKEKSNKVTILEKLPNEKWKEEGRKKKRRERGKVMRMNELELLPYPLYWSNSNTSSLTFRLLSFVWFFFLTNFPPSRSLFLSRSLSLSNFVSHPDLTLFLFESFILLSNARQTLFSLTLFLSFFTSLFLPHSSTFFSLISPFRN